MTVEGPAAAEILVDRRALRERVTVLAEELTAGFSEPPVAVAILKGSAMFLADLVRAMHVDVEVDFMSITSYAASGRQSGVVRIVKDLDTDIHGRDVVIVEDIVDTGLTLTYLRRTLSERGPRSLRAVTLLDKAARRIVPVELEHRGFEIPDVFVVGYGLDFQGRYRNVPDVLQVNDLAKLANDPALLADQVFAAG